MKIYTEVIIDMRTGSTVSEESFDYKGEIAECRSYQYRNSKTTNFADGSYTIMRDKFTKAGFLSARKERTQSVAFSWLESCWL